MLVHIYNGILLSHKRDESESVAVKSMNLLYIACYAK